MKKLDLALKGKEKEISESERNQRKQKDLSEVEVVIPKLSPLVKAFLLDLDPPF